MTVSIRTTLARAEGGMQAELSWVEVGQHFLKHCLTKENAERQKKAAERQRLYDGGGDDLLIEMIQKLLSNSIVQKLRERCVEFTKVNNPAKRVCDTKGTVYLEPAKRRVTGPENDRRYQEVQRLSLQDEVFQQVNHLLLLHEALWVAPRMREMPTGALEPGIDVVTPATFTPVRDPIEPGVCVGVILELDCQLARDAKAPKWRFVGYHETFLINSAGEVIEASIEVHGLGTMPGVFLQLAPSPGRLLNPDASADLVAAHLYIWFEQVLHLKESKSATKQPVVTGDVSRAARDQVDDSEVPVIFGDGVTVTVLDRSMDFSKFLADAQQVYEATAANHGIPPELLRQGAIASADAREALRAALKEQRTKQQPVFRRFERQFVLVQSKVVSKARPDLAFTTDGWTVDFADPQAVVSPKERNEIFKQERELGLTNTLDELIQRNKDLTPQDAVERLLLNIIVETFRNRAMRPLQQISGSMGANTPSRDAALSGTPDETVEDQAA